MERKDWLLLLLAAAHGKVVTPAQLVKTAFLLGRERADYVGPDYYTFVAGDYGPFCLDVFEDAAALSEADLLVAQVNSKGRWTEWRATVEGWQKANALRAALPESVTAYIDAIVQWARQLTFQQLIVAIYKKYPEMRENAVFQS